MNQLSPYVSPNGVEYHLAGSEATRHARARALLETLREAERSLREPTLRKAQGYVRKVQLDQALIDDEGGQWHAGVQGTDRWPYGTDLNLDYDHFIAGVCTCPAFGRGTEACKHLGALILFAIKQLVTDLGYGAVIAQPRGGWKNGLEVLDDFLASAGLGGPGDEEPQARERVVWRVTVHPRSGDPSLFAYLQKPKVRGGYTKGKKLSRNRLLERHDLQQDPEVAAVCQVLRNTPAFYANAGEGIVGERGWTKLAMLGLVGSSRVSWHLRPEVAVRVERGELRLRLTPRPAGAVALEAWFGGAPYVRRYRSGEARVLFEADDETLWVGEFSPLAVRMAEAVQRAEPVFPAEAWEQLVARLSKLEGVLPLEVDEALCAGREPADGRLRVRLSPERDRLRVALKVAPSAGELAAPGVGEAVIQGWGAGRRLELERDLPGERALALEVAARLGLAEGELGCVAAGWSWSLELVQGLDAVAALEVSYTDDPRVLVEWPLGEALSVSRELSPKDLRVTIDEAHDWFGLQAGLEVDGETIPLEALIGALERGERYVALDRGRWLALSRTLQDQLRALTDVAQPVERGGKLLRLEVDPTAAHVLEEVLLEAGEFDVGERWGQVRARLARAQKVAVAPPKALRAELRDYQREGFAWLKRLSSWGVGACLADDMGLGKTLQALAVLLARKARGPALVVAPTSVGGNWVRELERFTPSLRAIDYRSSPRSAEFLAGLAKRDVVIVSYDLARIDRAKLAEREWGSAVFDEAQQVKNSTTKTAKALRTIRAEWRVALTGTPVENHLGDLWSLFALVSPGLFGSWERFKRRFAQPIERDRDPERAAALARLIQPFVLRRTKEGVLTDLPPRTEVNLTVELSEAERRLYEETRLATVAELMRPKERGEKENQRRFQILAALTRLRQLACHPGLVDASWREGSAKLEAFMDLVFDLREGGHRALVFSQFVRHLDLVQVRLEAAGFRCLKLTGSTPAKVRQQRVDAFQAGEGELFLISLKAGGKGLNLTGADYVIHLDPWWNPAVEDQASDRAHRIGQTRPVTVYRLVTQGTIEDTILALHAEKRDLVDQVLAGSDRSGKLSPEELLGLLRGEGEPVDEAGPPLSTSSRASINDAQVDPRPGGGAGRAARAGSKATRRAALGSRLKALRAAQGLTQAQLAQLLGASSASVSRWELGSPPRPAVVERLAQLEGKSAAAIRRALKQG